MNISDYPKELPMIYDFHTHTLMSDGVLSAVELIRRAEVAGYAAIGITDHTGAGTLEVVINAALQDCELIRQHWKIKAIPGVELTHIPPESIAELAAKAKELGAKLVIVHGQTIVEPVPPGTNMAALQCTQVDILAHPGLLTAEEAALAAKNNIYLELSARQGHSLSNGLVAKIAAAAGAKLLVNSDAHTPSDILSEAHQRSVAQSAGLNDAEIEKALHVNPAALMEKILR
jgi:histidinol phosphatase-like PHP family hydrolase